MSFHCEDENYLTINLLFRLSEKIILSFVTNLYSTE